MGADVDRTAAIRIGEGGRVAKQARGLRLGIDVETAETYITSPAAIREAYLENINKFLAFCKKQCQSSGVDYCLVNTSQPLDGALTSYISRRARSR